MLRVERECKQDPLFEGLFVVRGFDEKRAEYQLARVGKKGVRVRTIIKFLNQKLSARFT